MDSNPDPKTIKSDLTQNEIDTKETPLIENKSNIPNISTNPSSSIPKILDIQTIKKKVVEIDALKKSQILELTIENVNQFWNSIIEIQKSHSLKAYMRTAVLSLERKEIRIAVGSILAKEAIRKEAKLEDSIRETFHDDQLKAIIEIDPELADKEEKQKPKKLLSAKEKWEMLSNVNPTISALKDKLELKIDED